MMPGVNYVMYVTSWYWRVMQNLKKTDLLFPRIWWLLIRELKSLKNLHFDTLIGPFCAKYITFELKKYRGVIFHDTEELCIIWRKTDLQFGKWHEEFSNFDQNTWKCQNWFFHGILLSKVESAWPQNLQRSYV